MKRVGVIGAGASGLMAAFRAGYNGADVTLFEKNEKAGKKIYITGKGRCNVTNNCSPDEFFKNVISNPKFMYKSFYAFSNYDLMDFIEKKGTPLKVERGGRVFPKSDHASDITKALVNACESVNVKFSFNNRVEKLIILPDDGQMRIAGLRDSKGNDHRFDAVVVATGGATYPGAGGCKDGYEFAKKANLRVTEIMPSLVPFLLKEDYIKDLQGLSLKNVTLVIKDDEKTVFKEFGEMLFTHFGISGPLVLTASSKIGPLLKKSPLKAEIDLKPAIPDKELDKRLLEIIEKNGKKMFSSFYDGLLPKSLKEVMIRLTGIDPESRIYDLDKNKRKIIFSLLRAFPGTITGLRGFNEAIITKGGVDVKEIDPKTMESKKVRDLFFCGEVLDIDALTGGFNLQCAFSTGFAAGDFAGGK